MSKREKLSVSEIGAWIRGEQQYRNESHVQVSRISTADTQFKRESGATLVGELCEAAQKAADKILRVFLSGRAQRADGYVQRIHIEHEARIRAVLDVERRLAEAHGELDAFESAANTLLPLVQRDKLVRLADRDADWRARDREARAMAVLARVRASQTPTPQRAPVPEPDFDALILG